ncbi:MAG: BMP family ABC transporter substrate-binding protein [Clostridiales bacterium]|nr:BMP family ABC transporter substrate-binding protein [Clostridiales bacterium]
MFKKLLSVCMVVFMLAALCVPMTSCTKDDGVFRLGVILLHDEASTYDLNFIEAVNKAAAELGLAEDQVIFKRDIPESNECFEAAADLVDQGCDVIFANSFGHEDYVIKAAKEYPDVEFCHATGTKAHTEGLDNYHNAFASIYEGRFLAGIAAGMKLNEMIEDGDIKAEEAKIGYVGAFTYAEVMSGYTSFYLGAKYMCPSVTMEVQFTGSWYNEDWEKNAAIALINNGCVLISQHADSMGAPSVCEDRGVPNVSYNGSTISTCENTFIISSKIDWTPYFKLICEKTQADEAIPADWTGTIATGSVALTDVNTKAAAEGTQAKIDEIKAKLVDGTLHVFDTTTFTVTVVTEGENTMNTKATVDDNGHLTGYMADVNTDAAFAGDTQVVSDGYFHESEFRSAPYFDIEIDGIELLNRKY